ncbi:class C sortase [Enterococcus hermanniensis]|uniref:Sortase n=1 Tax=Enterococcus hermanniensis TaxID=249189 RepID=A0A1L8TPE6_9ENTE|nr:class C sortase [Enterococcus hermanniensis]OJG45992.1 sortase [Enterococcus hermanniensis]
MIVVFLVGVLVMTYPFYINAINDWIDQKRMEEVQKQNEKRTSEQLQQAKERMEVHNKKMQINGLVPRAPSFTHSEEQKIITDKYLHSHLIGAISIPSIEITLPLFDTTNEKLLQEGATVLQGTSYPTGGINTHAVISAHSGLPEKKLFTDLEEVKKEAIFVISLFDEKLAYKVDKIEIVKPADTSVINIEAGRDIVTLLTCTPYMINSHRLLVTGHRVPYTEKIAKTVKRADDARNLKQLFILLGIVITISVLLSMIYTNFHKYFLKKHSFNLTVKCLDSMGNPLANVQLVIYSKNGKLPIQQAGLPMDARTDTNGFAHFEKIAGGVYYLKVNEVFGFKFGTKKLRAQKVGLYLTKKQKEYIFTEENTVIVKC